MMNNIYLLDCTLRDGGYVNNWMFGHSGINSILNLLSQSGVEYIECGYLNDQSEPSPDSTKYTSLEEAQSFFPELKPYQHIALMIDYGTYNISHLPKAVSGAPIIRVCFHKNDLKEALSNCKKIIAKGYQVFLQPMVTMNYSDEDFLQLIKEVNEIKPACFYIVDSFGSMELSDFQRLLFLTDHNLHSQILLGYHPHNNLQQAYENAKYMVSAELSHDVVLDASVYGMGRGAGNLNMELFASYLNTHFGKSYSIDKFLEIMDEHLKPIFSEKYWGYSLPFYLSARCGCHPNYASYFSEKNTLSYQSLGRLLMSLSEEDKVSFSKEKAEAYYSNFVTYNIDDRMALQILKDNLTGRSVLLLAPGRSLLTEEERIKTYISNHNCLTIAVGTLPELYKCDYYFCSNERRFRQFSDLNRTKVIITSNIRDDSSEYIKVNYASYLTGTGIIASNPVLMALRMLISMEIKEIAIAGFDGYSLTADENYYDPKLTMGSSAENKVERNNLISEAIQKLKGQISINFITNSLYIH